MLEAIIFTDGSSGKNKLGGYAAIVLTENEQYVIRGSEVKTTNNRMELLAAIKALESLNESYFITLVSDSTYMVYAIEKQWYPRWLEKPHNRPNLDLWMQISDLLKFHKVKIIHVRGHSDNKLNNMVDKLAVESRKKQIEYTKEDFEIYESLGEVKRMVMPK